MQSINPMPPALLVTPERAPSNDILGKASTPNLKDQPLDLAEGALEAKFAELNVKLSKALDKILQGRMQGQKDMIAQIDNLNNLLSELRKLQKSPTAFSLADLEKANIDLPEGSKIRTQAAERKRDSDTAAVEARAKSSFEYLKNSEKSALQRNYDYLRTSYERVEVESIGYDPIQNKYCWVYRCWTKEGAYRGETIPVAESSSYIFDHKWPVRYARDLYLDRQNALAKIEKEYQENKSGKASLGDLLYGYGVYKNNEKLPETKEQLEAATEKILAMVGTIDSTQQLELTSTQKFQYNRNLTIDQAVEILKKKASMMMDLIRMIGAH